MKTLTIFLLGALSALHVTAAPLNVCATTPDLGDIAKAIGGKHVTVTTFVKGRDNAHFLEARPSFIKAMSKADLYLQIGLELEIGWAPAMLDRCRNAKVQPGALGHLDVGALVHAKYAPKTTVDRSHGDVHAGGSPHYMLDPVYGLRVATLVAERLAQLRPEARADFAAQLKAFNDDLGERLVGRALAAKYDPSKLMLLYEHGRLKDFLRDAKESEKVGGWAAKLESAAGQAVLVDHDEYRYLLDRFRIKQVGQLEPKPGMAPTTRHLREVVEVCEKEKCRCIFATVYFPPKHAALVSRKCGVPVVALAHQTGSRPEASSYVEMLAFNVAQLHRGLVGR